MTVGVIVMAYGTPSSPDHVEQYYTHIRRGRTPPPELVADLRARYEAIGGVSPLRRITEAQAAAIGDALGDGFLVTLGMKHAEPFIEDGVTQLVRGGVDWIAGVVLAPHYSRASVGEYLERMEATADDAGVRATGIHHWYDLDAWLNFEARAVRDALKDVDGRATVVFTAHALPERVLDGDPYAEQLHESARAIAERAGIHDWSVAWQSAGRTPDVWCGPDIKDVLPNVDADSVVVCPQGFTADHLEVLYDIDVLAATRARELGLGFARTRSLNADRDVLGALADRIRAS